MKPGRPLPCGSIQTRELSPNEMARLGSNLFGAVVWLQGIVILFLTPAFLAGAIAEDRQRKVLSYLLASPLTGAEIVLGKLAARVMNLAMLVTVGLPVVSLALLFGGIEPQAVWLAYAASFSTLYFLAGLSIFVSVYSPRPRDSILLRLSDRRHLVLPADFRVSARPDGRTAGGDARRGTTGHRVDHDHQPVFLAARGMIQLAGSVPGGNLLDDRAAAPLRNAPAGLGDDPFTAVRERGQALGPADVWLRATASSRVAC